MKIAAVIFGGTIEQHLKPSLISMASELIHYRKLTRDEVLQAIRETLDDFKPPLSFFAKNIRNNNSFLNQVLDQAEKEPPKEIKYFPEES